MKVMGKPFCFTKYQGAGNDFILASHDDLDQDDIIRLCSRQYGIGADGLVLTRGIGSSEIEARFFNCDGSEAMMCGNALRCTAHIGFTSVKEDVDSISVLLGGYRYHCFQDDLGIRVKLPTPTLKGEGEKESLPYYWIDTGTDHIVVQVSEEGLMRDDFKEVGHRLSRSDTFLPVGVNVNFAWRVANNHIKMRTYEKGVYDETLACGSGAAAVVYAYALLGKKPCTVCVEFVVSGEKLFFDVEKVEGGLIKEWSMIGSAIPVFTGEISL